jgi:hypothetical protein
MEANIQSELLLVMSGCDPQNLQPRSNVRDPNCTSLQPTIYWEEEESNVLSLNGK